MITMNRNTKLVIGSRVYSTLYGGRRGVIFDIERDDAPPRPVLSLGGLSSGGNAFYDVVFDNGTISRRLPECIVKGVQWRLIEGLAGADEIADMLEHARITAERVKYEQEQKAALFESHVQHLRLSADHAYLTQGEDESSGRLAAINIRLQLKSAFPGIKFSVRKPTYGCVHVEWMDGPTTAAVEAIVSKYQAGSFDSMEDLYSYNIGAFHKVFGGARYVNTRRSFSAAHLQKAIDALLAETPGNFRDIERPTVEAFQSGSLHRVDVPGFNHSLQSVIHMKAAEL